MTENGTEQITVDTINSDPWGANISTAILKAYISDTCFDLYFKIKTMFNIVIVAIQFITMILMFILVAVFKDDKGITQLITTSANSVVWALLVLSIISSKVADRIRNKILKRQALIYECIDSLVAGNYKGVEILKDEDGKKKSNKND